MALPKKLESLIATITPQTDIERELLRVLTKRLANSLATLQAGLGCADKCYAKAIKCVLSDKKAECLDQYEECMESCIADTLRRLPTEAEDELLGELVSQVKGITEVLLTLAGVELIEPEEPEDEEADQSP